MKRLARDLKRHLALQLYREGLIAGGAACRLAEVPKAEFQYLLGESGIAQQYDVEDYEADLEHLGPWRTSAS